MKSKLLMTAVIKNNGNCSKNSGNWRLKSLQFEFLNLHTKPRLPTLQDNTGSIPLFLVGQGCQHLFLWGKFTKMRRFMIFWSDAALGTNTRTINLSIFFNIFIISVSRGHIYEWIIHKSRLPMCTALECRRSWHSWSYVNLSNAGVHSISPEKQWNWSNGNNSSNNN